MARKSEEPKQKKLRDLAAAERLEVERAKAKIAAERVKIGDAKAAIDEHQATIDNIRGK